MELAFILFAAISLLVGASNALTSKDVVRLLKKTTDKNDKAMLKGMVWCKGSHGFHFVFGVPAMALMAFGDHQWMTYGMWGMLGVSILAGLMSLTELWERWLGKVDDAVDAVIPDPSIRTKAMLDQIKNKLHEHQK